MAINSEKARTLRFEKVDAAKSYTMRLHLKLGDFPHDNINRDLVKQACATNEPFCLIINTGDKDTRGEHWTALYHGSTSGGSKYVEYIDPFASLPYKKGR